MSVVNRHKISQSSRGKEARRKQDCIRCYFKELKTAPIDFGSDPLIGCFLNGGLCSLEHKVGLDNLKESYNSPCWKGPQKNMAQPFMGTDRS